MTSDDFTNKTPFVLEEYFHGKTRAWGLFEDRFGTVQRSLSLISMGIGMAQR